jgi:hypothetical protein
VFGWTDADRAQKCRGPDRAHGWGLVGGGAAGSQLVAGVDLPFRGVLSVRVMAMRILVANGKDGGWRLHPALVAGGVYGRQSGGVKKGAG